jgi:CRP-like cAMP-binding protein
VDFQLDQVQIFSGLSANALKFVAARARYSSHKALEVVVHEGELGNRLFFIEKGEVRACRNFSKAGEKELARLGAGDCFGEMCILDTLPRSATIQATRDTVLHSLDTAVLYELHLQYPAQFTVLVLNLARELSRRLRQLDKAFAAWQ